MASHLNSETNVSSGSSNLENRVARMADPNSDLATKYAFATEIREFMDTTRDVERVLPYLIPATVELLRSSHPSFQRDTTEYHFRRILLDIINRLQAGEAVKPNSNAIFHSMLNVIRLDNEENGATACKVIIDIIRNYRVLTEQGLTEFVALFQEAFSNVKGLVDEFLSENSSPVDSSVFLPALRSFKVVGEMGMVLVVMSQVQRALVSSTVQSTTVPAFEFLALESPVQSKTKHEYEARGSIWVGMAEGVHAPSLYTDLIQAQIRMLSFLAYVMRYAAPEGDATYGERLVSCSLRIMQDCPTNGVALRKELMVVFRHLLATPARRTLLNHVDKLMDERVLLGNGLATKDLMRPMVYSAVADLIHNIKGDLSFDQLARIVHVYSSLLFNSLLGFGLHILFAKVLFGLTDTIVAKDSSQGGAKLVRTMFEACLERLEGLCAIQPEVSAALEKARAAASAAAGAGTETAPQETVIDGFFIEKSRPVGGALYALEKPEDVIIECRQLYRALLHGFRVTLIALKKLDAPSPDGTLAFRLFEGCVSCMSLYDLDPRLNEQNDIVDWFGHALMELDPHVFQEVWTHKIAFFFASAQKRIVLLNVCQFLFNREVTTSTLLVIVLKFLIERLPQLGEYDEITAAATIRLFKMAFNAVAVFPVLNEPILASQLSKLLMDCFPLAAKASKPTHYFILLRALFRAIGVGGGRFEMLYNAVLPLLPEMLESLNRQLLASDGLTRDMIVELCLTVPLRLTHLLPHLSYLMQPLALALRGTPEMASQGLRTLELCIDNLTPDFLDPTLSIVLRELMEALFNHLKPAPQSHHLAHTTIRILGKLGGRNRRLLQKEPALTYHHYSEPAKMSVSFNGNPESIALSPIANLAVKSLPKLSPGDQIHAYSYLENCASLFLYEGLKSKNIDDFFVKALEGLFDCIHIPSVQSEAQGYLRKLSSTIFEGEIRRNKSLPPKTRVSQSPLLSAFLDSIPHALARDQPTQIEQANAFVASLIEDLVQMKNSAIVPGDILVILHHLANRFTSLCLDDSWTRKNAGCNGIRLMASAPDLGHRWIADREVDLIRTLVHVLKDLPHDLPRNVDNVVELLIDILKISNSHLDLSGDGSHVRTKLSHLAGMFFPELQSPNPIVREASQKCIFFLVELSGRAAVELLMPHRDRMLGGIYTKPLRALPFMKQIGMIEAVRFCVSLDPPLVELNDELLRLLHETLALADAEDNQLLGPRHLRQSALEVVKLRIACIKLLTAAMPLTDFFSRQPQTRQRVTSVYFKSLYSPSSEVKDVAHEGLRMVLTHQSRLPKELLQTGLRPILMNLADPKRLSISGLEGLARLLELLTNYFKVEIGHKLLDHFRIVADPQALQMASKVPFSESEGIPKLVKLAHIFHLLPPAAGIFLEHLINAIVQTETQMHFSTKNPFSEPLGKYLNRFPVEGINYLLQNLKLSRTVRTYRNILQAHLAPNLERELASNLQILAARLTVGSDPRELKSALQLCDDLTDLDDKFFTQYPYIVDVLVALWNSIVPPAPEGVDTLELTHWHAIIQRIFIKVLKQSPRIDLLFELVSIYTRNLELDTVSTTNFLYQHVALGEDLFFRRNVLLRFITWFNDPKYTWQHKCFFLRYVVTPTLLVQASRSSNSDRLIDTDFIAQLHRLVWTPLSKGGGTPGIDDMFRTELLHLTTTLVQYYPDLLEDVKKDIVKYIWFHISNCEDVIVKQMGYLLAARFFSTFPTPPKFILRAWTGLLQLPHSESRPTVRYEALSTLVPCLPMDVDESGYPFWAKETRRILSEEPSSHLCIYHLIVKQPDLFFPVRSLFIPHMTSTLNRLGLSASSVPESRSVSVEVLATVFKWEERAAQETKRAAEEGKPIPKELRWRTPLALRETMVGYLMRLATITHETAVKVNLTPRVLSLLQSIVGPNGWNDVTVGLRFFARALEQNDFASEAALAQGIAAAKVLQVVAADQPDSWYIANAPILQKLIMKGLLSEDATLQDILYPIFDKLLSLFPLTESAPSGDTELAEFHRTVHNVFAETSMTSSRANIRGVLLIVKSVVRTTPEMFSSTDGSGNPGNSTNAEKFMKLFSELVKDHIRSTPGTAAHEANVRLLMMFLDICRDYTSALGESRRWLLTALVALVDKTKSVTLCKYLLDMAKTWVHNKHAAYPINKEKASLMQKLANFESRGDALFTPYLELVYDIYTDPSLRRSELTSRLENSFLIGCRAKDSGLRERFMDLLDVSVSRSLFNRVTYILAVQNWEVLADQNWIYLALHLLLGAADLQVTNHTRNGSGPLHAIPRPEPQHILRPLQRLLFLDPQAANDVWVSVFPAVWASLSRREQSDVTNHMINLLSKDYHIKQASLRPNVIQTLLAGIHACSPPMTLPPHLVKYLAKNFGCWHIALEILGSALDTMKDDDPTIRDYIYDSLAEIYAELAEEDMFYGLWRRRSLLPDTNIGLAFEQVGMWEQASTVYESAQAKVRGQTLPFNELEYCLWEDHWVLAAEKLQQWDILYEFAKSEGNQELMLESAWRTRDWSVEKDNLEEQINRLPEVATPRRRVFEAFIALLKLPAAVEKNVDFTRCLEDAMQLSLRKWIGLPQHFSVAHIPLLQHFQQFVELQEAVQIFGSLSQTNAQNLEKKSSELKMVLQAWRERLPNIYDDINIWSDLVAWRQNVFNAINLAYMPLIGGTNQASGNNSANTSTYGYRGYHETAWIINRFAHVARKHGLLDVCHTFLTKIYTLPNIEISEAFLKLREQAKCHYQKPTDLNVGLDVINNTNLMFFSATQKAEFHTLKAMFFAKLGKNDDANYAHAQAAQLDMSQAKCWAEWGKYHDRMFKAGDLQNADYSIAASAVSCYMQAVGLYKCAKSRPLLARILWLLSIDDQHNQVAKAFDGYTGDGAYWYWITLVPHLISSLQHRESKQARFILQALAKHFPQAIFYQLRTNREELHALKRHFTLRAQQHAQQQAAMAEAARRAANADGNGDVAMADGTAEVAALPPIPEMPAAPRIAYEHVEEIMQVLKTAFPLLILSLETMVDQIQHKFKQSPEEDVYRNISLLMQDAIQSFVIRMNAQEDDGAMNQQTILTLQRMSGNMPIFIRKDFEDDFVNAKITHAQYMQRLQNWRDKFEKIIDGRPAMQPLALLSHYLTEFQYSKVDEIEVPGQYTEDKDSNQSFVRIQKYAPKFETYRSNGSCWKRFTLYGNDHSKTSFLVQLPCHRQSRREERVIQILRTFNGALDRKKESRRRNLNFHLPPIIACSPNVRLFQTDSSYVSLGDIYDLHCDETGISKEEPILYSGEKVKQVLKSFRDIPSRALTKTEYISVKKDIFDEISAKMVPENILTNYMIRTMDGPIELWRMRKQFTLQLAAASYATWVLSISSRNPTRFQVSRSTGLVAMTELLPGISSQLPVFASTDVVPFRFTPNMQHFVGSTFMEGILAPSIMAIGQSLTDPEFDLDYHLCLFSRDEVAAWLSMRGKNTPAFDPVFRQSVQANIDNVVKKAEALACKSERENAMQPNVTPITSVLQTVVNQISTATNPLQLAKMGELYNPWF